MKKSELRSFLLFLVLVLCVLFSVNNNVAYAQETLGTPTATAIPVDHDTVKVTWSRVIDADGYYIYWAEHQEGPYTLLRTVQGGRITGYKIGAHTPGKTYWYQVQAYQADQSGARSAAVSTTMPEKLSVPQNLQIVSINKYRLRVTWTPVPEADYYVIYRGIGDTGPMEEYRRFYANGLYINGHTAGKTYRYSIAAGTYETGYDHIGEACTPVAGVPLPKAPTAISAAPVNSHTVNVTWKSIPDVDGYRIYRAEEQNGPYTPVRTVDRYFTNSTSVNGHETGKTYWYKVASYCNVSGEKVESLLSDAVSIYTEPDSSISAPEKVTLFRENHETIRVNWSAVEDADGYLVYRCESANSEPFLFRTVTNPAVKGMRFTGHHPGITYYYQVAAYKIVNGQKVVGAKSEKLGTRIKLTAPTSVKLTPHNSTILKLTFDEVPGALDYHFYIATNESGPYKHVENFYEGFDGQTYYLEFLKPGTTYWVKVSAYYNTQINDQHFYTESDFSASASAKAQSAAPADLSVTQKDSDTLTVSWKAISEASGYYIYRAETENGNYILLQTVTDRNITGINVDSCETGKTYWYKVSAYRTVGNKTVEGVLTQAVSGVCSAETALATPTNVRLTREDCETVRVNWSAVDGADGYLIYRAMGKETQPTLFYTVAGGNVQGFRFKDHYPGVKYIYQIYAYQTVGQQKVLSLPSEEASITTRIKAPIDLQASVIDCETLQVTCTGAEDVWYISEEILMSTSENGPYESIVDRSWTPGGSGNVYVVEFLQPNTTYWFKAKSYTNLMADGIAYEDESESIGPISITTPPRS